MNSEFVDKPGPWMAIFGNRFALRHSYGGALQYIAESLQKFGRPPAAASVKRADGSDELDSGQVWVELQRAGLI
jgi:hypothetical protein